MKHHMTYADLKREEMRYEMDRAARDLKEWWPGWTFPELMLVSVAFLLASVVFWLTFNLVEGWMR